MHALSPHKSAAFTLLLQMWKLLDFAVFRQLISRSLASYAISVRRTKDLPTASFRFHLTMDTLAVQLYISHYLGMFRTFTCESAPMARKRNVRRQAHIKKAEQDAGISACHLIQLLFLTNNYPPMNHCHSILFFSQSQEILTAGIPR